MLFRCKNRHKSHIGQTFSCLFPLSHAAIPVFYRTQQYGSGMTKPRPLRQDREGCHPQKFPYHMADSRYGVVKDHPRPRPAHHCAHPLPHLRAVTVHRALPAREFAAAEPATGKAQRGIVQQRGARRAQLTVAFLAAAVQPYHLFRHPLLLLNPVHTFSNCPAGGIKCAEPATDTAYIHYYI